MLTIFQVAYILEEMSSPEQLLILDVRALEEFNRGHIIGGEISASLLFLSLKFCYPVRTFL